MEPNGLTKMGTKYSKPSPKIVTFVTNFLWGEIGGLILGQEAKRKTFYFK